MKIGDFTIKTLEPMTDDEIRRQIEFVSEAAEACEYVTEQREIEEIRWPRKN
jgi:hypothetical protein